MAVVATRKIEASRRKIQRMHFNQRVAAALSCFSAMLCLSLETVEGLKDVEARPRPLLTNFFYVSLISVMLTSCSFEKLHCKR